MTFASTLHAIEITPIMPNWHDGFTTIATMEA